MLATMVAAGDLGHVTLSDALGLFRDEGWTPPQQWGGTSNWNVHDALYQSADRFEGYIAAVEILNAELREDVMLWEREPHRSEEEVIELFEKVLNG